MITNMVDILLIAFIVALVVIIIEWKLNYPFGMYDGIVLCLVPPFVKRIRIYKNRWIGFDKNWKFVFLKDINMAEKS